MGYMREKVFKLMLELCASMRDMFTIVVIMPELGRIQGELL